MSHPSTRSITLKLHIFGVLLGLISLHVSALNPFISNLHGESKDVPSTRFNLSGMTLGAPKPSSATPRQLIFELKNRTQVDPRDKAWSWTSATELDKAPPLLWIFVGPKGSIEPELVQNLQRYIENGGTIVVEGMGASSRYRLRELQQKVFGDDNIHALKEDDLLTRTFYILPPSFSSQLKTVIKSGRVVWVESSQPLLRQLENTSPQREMRIRSCINICLYTLTGSYKDDLTHLKYLMRRRKS